MKTKITKKEIMDKYRSEMFDCNMDECDGYYESEVSKMLDEYASQFKVKPPTEDRINTAANRYYINIPKDAPKRGCDIAFIRDAAWMRDQMKGVDQ